MRRLHRCLTEVCGNADLCGKLGLEEPLDMGTCLIDGTCLEANIHFPVDWVLLRDVAVTLLKATKLIRAEGLVCRMPESPITLAPKLGFWDRLYLRAGPLDFDVELEAGKRYFITADIEDQSFMVYLVDISDDTRRFIGEIPGETERKTTP